MVERATQREGWVAYLDVFGFTSYIQSDAASRFFEGLERAQLAAQAAFELNQFTNYFMFSDTIILWLTETNTYIGLTKLMELISRLQNIFFDEYFIFRGAVTFGEQKLSRHYILGDAYIRAYRLEAFSIKLPQIIVPIADLSRAFNGEGLRLPVRSIVAKNDDVLTGHHIDFLTPRQRRILINENVAFTNLHTEPPRRDEFVTLWDTYSRETFERTA